MLNRLFVDNPLLMRHVRSRLRQPQGRFLTSVVFVLACCLVWGGYEARALDGAAIFTILFVGQAIALHLAGTSQVASSIGMAKDSHVLDFHRISPLAPLTTTSGFILGAPVREHLMALVLLPFALVCAGIGSVGIAGFVTSGVVLLSSTLLFHTLAITAGLVSATGKTRDTNMGLGFVIVVSSFFTYSVYAGIPIPALLTAGPALVEATGGEPGRGFLPTFFGLELPLFVQSLLYQIPLTAFLLVAASRRMAAAQAMLYSKSTALAFLVTVCVLSLGGIADHPELPPKSAVPFLAYVECIVGALLILTVSPAQSSCVNGIRRSRRIGMGRPPLWSDDSSNRAVAFVMASLIPASVQALQTFDPNMVLDERSWLIAGTAAASLIYFALAAQYFLLKCFRGGRVVFGLFFFFFWVLPLILSALVSVTFGDEAGELLASFSPLYGIGAGTWPALISAALLAVVFFALVFREENRIWQWAIQRELLAKEY